MSYHTKFCHYRPNVDKLGQMAWARVGGPSKFWGTVAPPQWFRGHGQHQQPFPVPSSIIKVQNFVHLSNSMGGYSVSWKSGDAVALQLQGSIWAYHTTYYPSTWPNVAAMHQTVWAWDYACFIQLDVVTVKKDMLIAQRTTTLPVNISLYS